MRDLELVTLVLGDARTSVNALPDRIAADVRTEWRVALVLLLLRKCHGSSATLEQLHALNSVALFDAAADTFVRVATLQDNDTAPDRFFVRYEPALSRAVDISVGVGLTQWTSTARLRLTEAGRTTAQRLSDANATFSEEKARLARLPGRVSQELLQRVLDRRR